MEQRQVIQVLEVINIFSYYIRIIYLVTIYLFSYYIFIYLVTILELFSFFLEVRVN